MIDTIIDPVEKIKHKALARGGSCGEWATLAECVNEHHYARKLYCGREWCSVCGKNGSVAHKRRIARVLKHAMQISTMGYIVIEFPDFYRNIGQAGVDRDEMAGSSWVHTKEDLNDTYKKILEVLGGTRTKNKWRSGGYFSRGISRPHWFGDKIQGKYNPHWNILVESGYLPKELINEIRQALRDALSCPELIFNYSYTNQPGKMYHIVEYMTRATFLNYEWDPYMAEQIYNFRGVRYWGSWNGDMVWSLDQVADDTADIRIIQTFNAHMCPKCGAELKVIKTGFKTGAPILWTKPIDSTWLIIMNAQEMGKTGYYYIPPGQFGLTEYGRINMQGENIRIKGTKDDDRKRKCQKSD